MAPILTRADFHSETWKKLEKILQQRLVDARSANDHPQSLEETAHLRGRIAELRYLLAQPSYLDRRVEDARQEIELGDISALY